MEEKESNFEIILPDGTVLDPSKVIRQKEEKGDDYIQGYSPEGKPKKFKFMTKSNCERCGECCKRDTPVILKDDIDLLREGIIRESDIYTIRENQKIRSSIDGEFYYSSMELIKLRPIFGSFTCLFYDSEEGCTIYERRPTACRLYECWSEHTAITGIEKRRLTREDLFGSIDILREAISRHEEKCSLEKLLDLVDGLRKGMEENFEKIVETILFDNSIRDWAKEKLGIGEEALPLIFGKPLFELLPLYGLVIEKENENYIIKILEEVKE